MVHVSNSAVALLEENRRSQGIPESHGVRIFGEGDGQGGMRVRLAFVDDAMEEDHRIEAHGVDFYIANEVSEPLSDVVIDTDDDEPARLVLKPAEPTG